MSKNQNFVREKHSLLSKICKSIICCITPQEDRTLADFSCQSDGGIDSTSLFNPQADFRVPSNDIKLFSENDHSSYNEDFKTSLQKLDHLIKFLNNVYSLCRENRSGGDTIDSMEINPEILTFNVNIKDDKFVHCHAKKGKYSLKIIDTLRRKPRSNPFSLHRCPPTLEISKEFNKNNFNNFFQNYKMRCKKTPNNLSFENACLLQRNYHTLSNIFSSQLVHQIASLRAEIQGLKQVFSKTQCTLNTSDHSRVSFKIGDLSRWLVLSKMAIGESLLCAEDVKLIHGKIRATHFCRFYKFMKLDKQRNGRKNRKKKAISQ